MFDKNKILPCHTYSSERFDSINERIKETETSKHNYFLKFHDELKSIKNRDIFDQETKDLMHAAISNLYLIINEEMIYNSLRSMRESDEILELYMHVAELQYFVKKIKEKIDPENEIKLPQRPYSHDECDHGNGIEKPIGRCK